MAITDQPPEESRIHLLSAMPCYGSPPDGGSGAVRAVEHLLDPDRFTAGRRCGGVRAKLYRAVCEVQLTRIVQVDLKSEQFTYRIDDHVLKQAQLMDGKLLLITNTQDLSPAELVCRYKSLAELERGFRVLKSGIGIGPVYHRLPERIKAHASICFIALTIYRVMRQRLRAVDAQTSPEKAVAQLRRIQHHRILLNGAQPNAGLSTTSTEQTQILTALNLTKPRLPEQLTLL